jgi:hypothetical protein
MTPVFFFKVSVDYNALLKLRATNLLSKLYTVSQYVFMTSECDQNGEVSSPLGWPVLALAGCPSRGEFPQFILWATQMSLPGCAGSGDFEL